MNHELDIEVDVLSESVVEVKSGNTYKTLVVETTKDFINTIHKKDGWKFSWKKESKEQNRYIYKLVLEKIKRTY